MNLVISNRTKIIRSKLQALGFDVGFASSRKLVEEEVRLENWLLDSRHGKMSYMENHFDMRLDPSLLHTGTKTVICVSYNYYPREDLARDSEGPKLSKYAYGKDYHKVIKKTLKRAFLELTEEIGDFSWRMCVDSAPILEKKWAQISGIGWVGKHSNVITKQKGSYYFLAEILTDLELEYTSPVSDHCGSCTKCIDACPTDAITPYNVDGSRCISYLTIELKDEIPNEFLGKLDNWAFGCDICQDVCPWNRFSVPTEEIRFHPNESLVNLVQNNFKNLDEDSFAKSFMGSAVKRTQLSGLRRNLRFLNDSSF